MKAHRCVVDVSSNYCRELHLWFTPFTRDELIAWWQNLPTCTGLKATDLPGRVVDKLDSRFRCSRLITAWEMYLDDSNWCYLDNNATNEHFTHKGYQPDPEFGDAFPWATEWS